MTTGSQVGPRPAHRGIKGAASEEEIGLLEELRRMALITSGVAELTKNRAEQVVKDLVKAGDVRKDQTSGLVKELLKRSQENRKELTRFVRSEITHQIEGLGLASARDLQRLERRITRLESTAPKVTKAASASTGSKASAPAKKTTKKAPNKKMNKKTTVAKKKTTKRSGSVPVRKSKDLQNESSAGSSDNRTSSDNAAATGTEK